MDQPSNFGGADKGSYRATTCSEQPSGYFGHDSMSHSAAPPPCCNHAPSFVYPHFPPLPNYFQPPLWHPSPYFQQYPYHPAPFIPPSSCQAGHQSCNQGGVTSPVVHIAASSAPNSHKAARESAKQDLPDVSPREDVPEVDTDLQDDERIGLRSPSSDLDIESAKRRSGLQQPVTAPTAKAHLRKEEPDFRALRLYLRSKTYLPGLSRTEKNVVRRQAKRFSLRKNDLYVSVNGSQVKYIETERERSEILEKCHLRWGHARRDLMLDKLVEDGYWRTQREDTEKFINSCGTCQKHGKGLTKVKKELKQIKIASKAWWLIGMDLVGPFHRTARGNTYILTVVDYYTKWCEAIPIPRKDALSVTRALHEIYARHGVPCRVISDNGGEFKNEIMKQMNAIYQIHHVFTRPYAPQTNGGVENFNKQLQKQLSLATNTDTENWDLHLNSALRVLRTRPHTTTRFSPHDLMYSFAYRHDCSVDEVHDDAAIDSLMKLGADEFDQVVSRQCEEMMRQHQSVTNLLTEEVGGNIKKEKLRQRKGFDARNLAKGEVVKAGDLVYFYPVKKRGTLQSKGGKGLRGPVSVIRVHHQQLTVVHGRTNVKVLKENVRVPRERPVRTDHEESDGEQQARPKRTLKRGNEDSESESEEHKRRREEEEEIEDMINSAARDNARAAQELSLQQTEIDVPAVALMPSVEKGPTAADVSSVGDVETEVKQSTKTSKTKNDESITSSPLEEAFVCSPSTTDPTNNDAARTTEAELVTTKRSLVQSTLKFEGILRKPQAPIIILTETEEERVADNKRCFGKRLEDLEVLRGFFKSKSIDLLEAQLRNVSNPDRCRSLPCLYGVLTKNELLKTKRSQLELKSLRDPFTLKQLAGLSSDAKQLIHFEAWNEIAALLDVDSHAETDVTRHVSWCHSRRLDLSLAAFHRSQLLSPTHWIGDEIVTTACAILSKQCPTLAGFRCSSYFQGPEKLTAKGKGNDDGYLCRLRTTKAAFTPEFEARLSKAGNRQSQILFVNGNHWLMVTNRHGESENVIYIYDSCSPHPDSLFKHQVCCTFRPVERRVELKWMPADLQKNNNDCGAFAIANMVELACGGDPSLAVYEKSKMRSHLMSTIEAFHLKPFPKAPKKTVTGKNKTFSPIKTESVEVICSCRMPVDSVDDLTCKCASNLCRTKIYHRTCIPDFDANRAATWLCPACRTTIVD